MSEEMIMEQLRSYGKLFRNAIQTLPLNKFPNSSFFEYFPSGCCGDTSDLFAKHLESKGIKTYYVWGLRGQQSHAWLEHGDIIIDLTADQFDGIDDEVIVTKSKNFHKHFRIQDKRVADFEQFNDFNSVRLMAIYKSIIENLNDKS